MSKIINLGLDILLFFSFYRVVQFQDSNFENIAVAMVWVFAAILAINLFVPESHLKKLHVKFKQGELEKAYHIIASLVIIVLCFYLGWFAEGICYLIPWGLFQCKKYNAGFYERI